MLLTQISNANFLETRFKFEIFHFKAELSGRREVQIDAGLIKIYVNARIIK